uniref:Uncharacterized protein n=1 Tax=Anguilla anguilla TaxID=7936 RepID=A0A0E9VF02_ANGAN
MVYSVFVMHTDCLKKKLNKKDCATQKNLSRLRGL